MSAVRAVRIAIAATCLACLAPTPPAVAAGGPPGEKGYLTLWDDTRYSDTSVKRLSYDSNFGNDGFNDKASSYVNKSGRYWILYDDKNYEDRGLCLRPYSHYYDLDKVGFGDKTSSAKREPKDGSCHGWPEVGVKNSEW